MSLLPEHLEDSAEQGADNVVKDTELEDEPVQEPRRKTRKCSAARLCEAQGDWRFDGPETINDLALWANNPVTRFASRERRKLF